MIIAAVCCLLALSGALASESECEQAPHCSSLPSCTAVYGGYTHHGNLASEMQAYANLHLERSFEYLLSAAYFNNYQTNRPGFTKLFRELSDNTWEKSIDLIKHITLRGDVMDFTRHSSHDHDAVKTDPYTAELHELEALAKAHDTQKELAERAFHIHRAAVRDNHHVHDSEITQYLEDEFVNYHAKSINSLAGYTSDLKKFITDNNGQDVSISIYLFDEYLQKTL